MTDDIEARLADLAGLAREKQLLEHRRAELDERIAAQSAELHDLRAGHAAELRDVERLESLSLSRVLVALRGSPAADLARERAETDAARYRVAEAESRLAALRAERQAVDARVDALTDLPARYAAALDARDRHLRTAGGPSSARLMALAEDRGRTEAALRELAEAVSAADVALGALGEVRRHLDAVRRFRSSDNWLGGALVLGNPNWLDGVAWAAAHADRCLAVLHTELADVGLARPLGSPSSVVRPIGVTSGFIQTVFSDMLSRDRILHAQRAVDHSAHLVTRVRQEAAERAGAARARWDAIMRERDTLLTG